MAPNADEFIKAVLAELEVCVRINIRFEADPSWKEREAALDRGEIELGWICGLPYIWKADRPDPPIRLLAAPVMAGERYAGKPVYYSDMVVRSASPYREFSDLKGTVWGYNEPGSHSGYNIVRCELARRGLNGAFFGGITEAGSHERALELLLAGEIDAAAIDSTVLETELARQPGLGRRIRILATLGPSPIPPIVASKALNPDLYKTVQRCLLTMHLTPAGRMALVNHRVLRFDRVDHSDYAPIRQMDEMAAGVELKVNR